MRRPICYTLLTILWTLCLTVNTGADVVVPEAEIHTAVRDYVRGLLSAFEGEVAVEVRRQGDLRVEGTGAVRVRVRPSQTRSSARMVPVTLEVCRGPVVIREYLLAADASYFDEVVVAARPIQRHEPIDEGAVAMERREVTTILGRYVGDVAELEGMRAKMRIGFGRPIDRRYVERTPMVERGDRVRIQVVIGGVRASTDGVAGESGAMGERILVQNPSSREKLVAEVIAPGVVQVGF